MTEAISREEKPGAFRDGKAVASYLGLIPSEHSSSGGRKDVLRRDFDMRAKNRAPFISAERMTTLYQ